MQPFWLSFLRDVFGISEPESFIRFEVPVKLKHTGFIDPFLPDTKVIIEQKSLSENLEHGKSQSDDSTLTSYVQAQRYGNSLHYSMRPRWIVVCNFAEFLIYDMGTLAKPTKILLSELPEKFHALDFLVDKSKNKLRVELEFSLKAGEIVGRLYDANHIFAESRPTHLKDFVPAIGIGNKPIDDGNYLFTFDEMIDFISREPDAQIFFRKWFASREFILNAPRYCLCLRDISPNELKNTTSSLSPSLITLKIFWTMNLLLSLLFFISTKYFLPKKFFQHKRISGSHGELFQKFLKQRRTNYRLTDKTRKLCAPEKRYRAYW